MSSGFKVNAWIFARGGSKGLPGKNLRELAGKPLLAHAIDAATGSRWIERLSVSTDSEEIAPPNWPRTEARSVSRGGMP